MTDYTKLVKELRGCKDMDYCTDCPRMANGYVEFCNIKDDAAAAIEALDCLLDQNTQRCEALRKQLREAHESYEKHLKELEAQLPKRGEWVYLYDGNYKCSVCGEWYGVDETPVKSGMNYCPNCGAKMTEVQDAATISTC